MNGGGVGGGSGGSGGDADSSGESIAESARKSLTLSLALAERFAHADSSTDEEDAGAEDAEPHGTPKVPTACNGICSAGAADTQQLPQPQHQPQHQPMHQCRSWNSEHEHLGQHPMERRMAPHERLMQETQRRKVCEEIVETERKYCSCLWTLIDLIGGSLRAAAFVSTRDLCLIFPNTLPRLYDLHAGFLARLEDSDCVRQPQRQGGHQDHRRPRDSISGGGGADCSLAAAVQQFLADRESQLLQLYRSYVAQFSPAMRRVRRCRRQSRKFSELLLALQRHPECEGLDLTAFLLTPIQRLPRYLLLLRQLADRTDPRHPDQGLLTQATARLRCLLEQLNCSIQGALADATASAGGATASESDAPASRRSRPSLPARLMRRPTEAAEASTAAVEEEASPDSVDTAATVAAGEAATAAAAAHFLLANRSRRRATQPELPWDSPRHLKKRPLPESDDASGSGGAGGPARCRSVPPEPAAAPRVIFQLSPETARRLRPGDRSRSVGDIIARRCASVGGASTPAVSVVAATAGESPQTRSGGTSRRRKSSPKATVKETFRKMFLSRRKVSDTRLGNSWSDL